jgi:hypothetical protein
MSVNRRELIAEWRTDFEALLDCLAGGEAGCASQVLRPLLTRSTLLPQDNLMPRVGADVPARGSGRASLIDPRTSSP